MKIIIRNLAFGLLFFNSSFSSAQDFALEALVPTTFNEHGDPQINKVDANGARQGDWFYNDHSNVLCVKEQYQDHNLVNSLIQVGTNEAPVWVNFNDFITSNSLINQASNYLKEKMNSHPVDWDLSQVLVYSYNGNLSIRFIGAWTSEQMNFLRNEISNYLNSPTNELPSNFKIVLA